ncbi:MAG: cation:proton antiporter [Candidatus Diapherotrites archaeon]|nr:cation:proton antiporter [Candidatus Diapherotrites archaeon]
MESLLNLTLLFDLGLILLSATVFNYLVRLLNQPNLLGYILAGLFIGPAGLGALHWAVSGIPVGITNLNDVLLLSELGVAFLLFGVGVESDFSKILKTGKTALIGGIVQVILTLVLVAAGLMALGIYSLPLALYLGLILAFSSTLIVVKILSDTHAINTLHGRLMFGFLLVQDLLAILAMPLLGSVSIAAPLQQAVIVLLQGVALIFLAFLLYRFVYPSLYRFASKSDETFFLVALSSAFLFILLSAAMHFPIAVGAFISGISLSTLPYSTEVFNKIRGVRDFFSTIFFVTLGIQITFGLETLSWPLIALILLTVFVLKPIIFFFISLFSGFGEKVALYSALGLAQVSEFSFILANQGRPVLETIPGLYSFVLLVVALSMLVTPYAFAGFRSIHESLRESPFMRFLNQMTSRFNHRLLQLESIPSGLHNHAIILGAGATGYPVVSSLQAHMQVAVVDHDPELIHYCIHKGIPSVYGEADNEEVLIKVNAFKARIAIIAIPHSATALNSVRLLRKLNPKIIIFSRAHYYQDAVRLYAAKANRVILPDDMASHSFIEVAQNALEKDFLESPTEAFLNELARKAGEEQKRLGL